MSTSRNNLPHTGGMGLFLIGAAFYLGLLILFGYQTWLFVDWLFPNDQFLMKVLTLVSFDILAAIWGLIHLFYKFASPESRALVTWAWAISSLLAFAASIFYMILSNALRFQVTLTQAHVVIGDIVTISALGLNFIFLTFWLYREWNDRHPHQDQYAGAPAHQPVQAVPASATQITEENKTPVKALPAPASGGLSLSDIQAFVAQERAAMRKEMEAMIAERSTNPTPAPVNNSQANHQSQKNGATPKN